MMRTVQPGVGNGSAARVSDDGRPRMPRTCVPTIGGAVEEDGLCRVHQTKPNYTAGPCRFPVDFPDQAAVDDFLTQTRNGFLNETQTPNFANVPYALEMTGSLWASDTTRSVAFEIMRTSAARIRTSGTRRSPTTRSTTAR